MLQVFRSTQGRILFSAYRHIRIAHTLSYKHSFTVLIIIITAIADDTDNIRKDDRLDTADYFSPSVCKAHTIQLQFIEPTSPTATDGSTQRLDYFSSHDRVEGDA